MDTQRLLDRIKQFDYHDLTAKHCFWVLGSPVVDGIKIFDKDDQATKHCPSFMLMFCSLVIFIKIFDVQILICTGVQKKQ